MQNLASLTDTARCFVVEVVGNTYSGNIYHIYRPNTCFFSEKHIFDIKDLVSVTTKNDKTQASAMNAWMLGSVGFSKLLRLIMRQKETLS